MEKTEEQIERERSAVDAMRNAKSNMTAALDRIATLEGELKSASRTIGALKEFISPNVYPYGNDKKTCRSVADDAIAIIAKVVG